MRPRFIFTLSFIMLALSNINSSPVHKLGSSLILKVNPVANEIVASLWEQGKASFRNGDSQVQFNRSMSFLEHAYRISDSLNRQDLINESTLRIGELYFFADSLTKGTTYFIKIIKYHQKERSLKLEADTWLRLGRMYSINEIRPKTIIYLEKARTIYQKINDWKGMAAAGWRISYAHDTQGKIKLAEKEMIEIIALKNRHNENNHQLEYNHLSDFNRRSGNLNKALSYSFKCLQSMQVTKDTIYAGQYYITHANIFRELGNKNVSIFWYRKAFFNFLISFPDNPEIIYGSASALIQALIENGKTKDGLEIMKSLTKKIRPMGTYCKLHMNISLGALYFSLKQYHLAEKYYNGAEKLINNISYDNEWITASRLYMELAKFNFHQRKYESAVKILNLIFRSPKATISLVTMMDAHLLMSKIDSVNGNYYSSLKNFKNYKALNDSVFNLAKSNQIEELQITYATAQNQKDLRLLQNREKLQKLKLAQTENTQKWTIGVAILLLLLLGISYNGYRLKQRSNLKLEAQRKQNERMNENLKDLVLDKDILIKQKDHLLKEKEWLLKEVHHRVKNNLHTVFCLLESQATYLQDDALKAIESSQHRIYAMSLIHQKLYQSNEVKAIKMNLYLEELIKYLSDSFGINQEIIFVLDIEQLKLDISQAIPLSLVINEAVTNAIKYAFVKKCPGTIKISMRRTGEDIKLEIADNGIGIDSAIIMLPIANTLGMKLMKGLCEDINATIQFSNESGTKITVNLNIAQVNNVYQVFGASEI